jgi:sec-independent protein translocase protein TatB
MTDLERKARDFRRKKLVRTSAVPAWYKNRAGVKGRVLSGAARVRKYRPGVKSNTSFF